jgi:hypothetical protein
MELIERARKYVEKLDGAVKGSGTAHDQTFYVAVVLVQGFGLGDGDAWALLCEYNQRCSPPWDEKGLRHKLEDAQKAVPKRGRGWLAGAQTWTPSMKAFEKMPGAIPAPPQKAAFDPVALSRFARVFLKEVDLVWLANRSALDPATVAPKDFLSALYDRQREKVLVFSEANEKGMPVTQGEAIWPEDEDRLPTTGKRGVWYLAAPVDGKFRETGEKDRDGRAKLSRRNGACVVSWRWMVLESDTAPPREWLAAIVRLPLRIAALYTSGGRSVHALIDTRARTKREWDDFKAELKPSMVLLGADPGCMSAVRLTRLPGCFREDKGKNQKLLYIQPKPDARPISKRLVLRDVVDDWTTLASYRVSDTDETRGQAVVDALRFYLPVREELRAVLDDFEKAREA